MHHTVRRAEAALRAHVPATHLQSEQTSAVAGWIGKPIGRL